MQIVKLIIWQWSSCCRLLHVMESRERTIQTPNNYSELGLQSIEYWDRSKLIQQRIDHLIFQACSKIRFLFSTKKLRIHQNPFVSWMLNFLISTSELPPSGPSTMMPLNGFDKTDFCQFLPRRPTTMIRKIIKPWQKIISLPVTFKELRVTSLEVTIDSG